MQFEQAQVVFSVFGGIDSFCQRTGISYHTAKRWPQDGGLVPTKRIPQIIEAAMRQEIPLRQEHFMESVFRQVETKIKEDVDG